MQHFLEDRAQRAGAESLLQRRVRDLEERLVREIELDLIERAQTLIFGNHRLPRLREDRDEILGAQRIELDTHRKAAEQLGEETVFDEIFAADFARVLV